MRLVCILLLLATGCVSSIHEDPYLRLAAKMTRVEQALQFFRLDFRRFPTTEEGLAALVETPDKLMSSQAPETTYAKPSLVLDIWGNPFEYSNPGACPTGHPQLTSLGPDGLHGGRGRDLTICVGLGWATKDP